MPYSTVPRLPIILCAFVLATLLCTPAIAEENISISVFSGLSTGKYHEIVYYGATDILSELVWPETELWSVGISAKRTWRNGFFAGASFSAGIPRNVDWMTDSDWLNVQVSPQTYEKTHYSTHETEITHAIDLEIEAGKVLSVPATAGSATLACSLALRYSSTRWEAHNGYIQYEDPPTGTGPWTPWSEATAKVDQSGPVMNYRYQYVAPMLRARLQAEGDDGIGLAFGLSVSPVLWVLGIDEHLLTDTIFNDYMVGLFLLEPSLELSAKTGAWGRTYLGGSLTWLPWSRGDTYAEYLISGTVTRSANTGGSSFTKLTIILGFETRLR